MILEKLDPHRLCFASIVMLNTYDTKVINVAVALLFCLRFANFYKKCKH